MTILFENYLKVIITNTRRPLFTIYHNQIELGDCNVRDRWVCILYSEQLQTNHFLGWNLCKKNLHQGGVILFELFK